MDWTMRQLQQFVVLAEEEHVGRAAARLHISQPPLTEALRRLERALGTALVERVGRNLRLTAAGRAFATDAAALLAANAAAADRARRVADGLRGTVRIGCIGSLAFGFIPDVLRRLATDLPEVEVELVQEPSHLLIRAVRSRELDIAVVRSASVDDATVRVRPLFDERLRLAVPDGHRLAGRKRVRMAELADEPLAAFGSRRGRTEEEDALRRACTAAGFVPNVVVEAVDLPGLLAWVSAGRALALVPAGAARIAPTAVQLVDIVDGGPLLISFAAAVRPDHDAAVSRVLDVMAGVGR